MQVHSVVGAPAALQQLQGLLPLCCVDLCPQAAVALLVQGRAPPQLISAQQQLSAAKVGIG